MSTCELVAGNAPLLHAYRSVVDILDTEHRAWIVGLGRLVDVRSLAESPDLRSVLSAALWLGEFPSSPFPLHLEDLLITEDYGMLTARADVVLPGERRLEYRIVAGPRAVAVALTRNGYLDDGTVDPGHVQLPDTESVLVDTVMLTSRLAATVGHLGSCHLALGIASDVPNQPLELRAYDEGSGERLRPPAGYDEFEPVYAEFRADLDGDELDLWLWDTSLAIAAQFGVFVPQLVQRPRSTEVPGWRVGPV